MRLVGTYSTVLDKVGHHDDAVTVALPCHLPDVTQRVFTGTLRRDVGVSSLVALTTEQQQCEGAAHSIVCHHGNKLMSVNNSIHL